MHQIAFKYVQDKRVSVNYKSFLLATIPYNLCFVSNIIELSNAFTRESTFVLFVSQSDLRFVTGVRIPVLLFHAVRRLQPLHPLPGTAGGRSIHQTTADAAELGRHGDTRYNWVCHSESGDLFFAADVCEGVAFEDEIGGEHGAGDFFGRRCNGR